MSPHDVLTPELSVLLDAAIGEHPEPWPEPVPDYWLEDDHGPEWRFDSVRGLLVHHGQYVAALRDGRWRLRRAPMFPWRPGAGMAPEARWANANATLDEILTVATPGRV